MGINVISDGLEAISTREIIPASPLSSLLRAYTSFQGDFKEVLLYYLEPREKRCDFCVAQSKENLTAVHLSTSRLVFASTQKMKLSWAAGRQAWA